MRVLVIKISSMGDIIHTLPALTDASKAYPQITFDWVVDKNFAEIPCWHPHVKGIIVCNHRYWRSNISKSIFQGELYKFWRQLREQTYDLIIDAQGSLKSAFITRMARGLRCGFDSQSVREPLSQLAYQNKFSVSKGQHAITRTRSLFAKALSYSLPTESPEFSLSHTIFPKDDLNLPSEYLVFITGTTWPSKHYPIEKWKKLIRLAASKFPIYLPWGSTKEHERTQELQKCHPNVNVLPKSSLAKVAKILSNARGVVSVDTGLGHMAAALKTPSVHLYGPTDPVLIGATGKNQVFLQSHFECIKCYKYQCKYKNQFHNDAQCLNQLHPEEIWNHLSKII